MTFSSVCESQASGPRVAQRRAQILARLIQSIDEGRREGKAQNISPLAAEGIVGGVLTVIQTRLLDEEFTQTADGKPLLTLTNELMSMIVLPSCGPAAARRELARPVPITARVRRDGGDGVLRSDPFKDAGMRLTYRTVRALTAIAQHPQASNREIGTSAGIPDQGQISKLLSRLQRVGLITNTGIYPGRGAPNSWALTAKGERMAQSIRTHNQHQSNGASAR